MSRAVLLLATMALAILAASGVALASQKPQIDRVPIDETVVNPCNGEPIDLTGTFQIVSHVHEDAGGGFHAIAEGNAQGIRGVGASGAQYRATGGFWVEFNSNRRSEVFNAVEVFNIIGQGSAPNFLLKTTFKYTINANGELTAEVVRTREVCRG
jgi:hypothetical protein